MKVLWCQHLVRLAATIKEDIIFIFYYIVQKKAYFSYMNFLNK